MPESYVCFVSETQIYSLKKGNNNGNNKGNIQSLINTRKGRVIVNRLFVYISVIKTLYFP